MTCILACIKNKKVHMMGDKQGSNGFIYSNYSKISKVFKNKEFLIGYTTSFRMGQLLQYNWEPPVKSSDDSEEVYLFNKVVTSILNCFKANDFGYKDKANWEGGNFLIGWRGRLFEMQPEMSLLEHTDFTSVGSGEYHAVAAMNTLRITRTYDTDPKKFLETALLVASRCVHGVSIEYNYISEV